MFYDLNLIKSGNSVLDDVLETEINISGFGIFHYFQPFCPFSINDFIIPVKLRLRYIINYGINPKSTDVLGKVVLI